MNNVNVPGLTLRDYFAAAALQALAQNENSSVMDDAIMAYQMADAMLEVREKDFTL